MIPERIKQIVRSSAIACAVVALCILLYDVGASVAFSVASAWVMANFLVWAVILGSALRPKDEPSNPMGLMMGLLGKLTLLVVGLVVLLYFAPYTKAQLLGILGGLSSVLIVAFLKALGSRFSARPEAESVGLNKDSQAKV